MTVLILNKLIKHSSACLSKEQLDYAIITWIILNDSEPNEFHDAKLAYCYLEKNDQFYWPEFLDVT